MAPALTPAGGRDPCGAGERGVCPRALPRLPSPLPGGRESSARSCEAARCDFGNVGPCSHLSARGGSGWFVLSWMLAGFLHSRHGITIAECHHRFGSSARQAGHIRDLGAPWLWRGCPAPRDERSGIARGRVAKRLRFHSAVCGGAGTGCFSVPLGNLPLAAGEEAAARVPSGSLVPAGPREEPDPFRSTTRGGSGRAATGMRRCSREGRGFEGREGEMSARSHVTLQRRAAPSLCFSH